MINVNIVCMDHYMGFPIKDLDPFVSEFRATSIDKLPILRIYGSTYEGVKACVHIHGVFPYFYIQCNKDVDKPLAFAYQLASALDKAINITLNQGASSQQHVYSVTLEQGIPIYGYHSDKHTFLKIHLYNPLLIKKASMLLQSGNILGSSFQPYECHIPYKQQFMIDFNLFGMNFVRFRNTQQRDDKVRKKQSVCPLEFDVLACDIINQYDIIPGNITCNPGIQYIRDEELKRSDSRPEDLEGNLTQNRMHVEPTASDLNHREKLRVLLSSKKGKATQSQNSQNESQNLSLSTLDVSVLNETELEEHAELLLKLWNANCDEEDLNAKDGRGKIDEDCILSQKTCEKPDEDSTNDMNMSLFDLIDLNNVDMNVLNKSDGKECIVALF